MMKEKFNSQRFIWTLLLFVAILLFWFALQTGNYLFNMGTVILGFIVYRFGYDAMFKEYDNKRKKLKKDVLNKNE